MKKRKKLALIRQYYPQAITTADTVEQLITFIEDECNLDPEHVMLADSICCDDVNNSQYPLGASGFLGPFK